MHIIEKINYKAAVIQFRIFKYKNMNFFFIVNVITKLIQYNTFQPVLKYYQYRGDKRRFYKVWDGMISKYKQY